VRGWKCAPTPCSSVLLLTLCLAPTRGRSVVVAQLGLLHLLCRQLDDIAIASAGAGPVQALRGHDDREMVVVVVMQLKNCLPAMNGRD
jgi:hypothetical protein